MNIKPLEWVKRDLWVAQTPAAQNGYIMIAFDQGKYWPVWNCVLPGYNTIEEAMTEGQKYHNAFVENFISQHTY